MLRLSTFLLAIFLIANFGAQADDAQSLLARQIERESETIAVFGDDPSDKANYYLFLNLRKYMLISGCAVTAEIEKNSHKGERVYGLTFDLARTRLPDPNDDNSQQWGVLDLGEHGKQGVIWFDFLAPYTPPPHGDLPERWSTAPVQRYNFVMEEMVDDEQPRRLLALLNLYQDEYCTFSG